jgi:hypothetical protein
LLLLNPGQDEPLGLLSLLTLVYPFVDLADLLTPDSALVMGQIQNRLAIPVQVISQEGYLLVNLRQGVAYDSPGLMFTSSISLQFGHWLLSASAPLPFTF